MKTIGEVLIALGILAFWSLVIKWLLLKARDQFDVGTLLVYALPCVILLVTGVSLRRLPRSP